MFKRGLISFQAAFGILAMDPFGPAAAEFLRSRTSREIKPGLVEEVVVSVGAGHPNHDGCSVGHDAEALFTLAQGRLARKRSVTSVIVARKAGRSHEDFSIADHLGVNDAAIFAFVLTFSRGNGSEATSLNCSLRFSKSLSWRMIRHGHTHELFP